MYTRGVWRGDGKWLLFPLSAHSIRHSIHSPPDTITISLNSYSASVLIPHSQSNKQVPTASNDVFSPACVCVCVFIYKCHAMVLRILPPAEQFLCHGFCVRSTFMKNASTNTLPLFVPSVLETKYDGFLETVFLRWISSQILTLTETDSLLSLLSAHIFRIMFAE